VKLSSKLKKLLNGEGWASARLHARRRFHREKFPLRTDYIIQSIDRAKLEQIRQRYAVEGFSPSWPKYLHLNRWIDINIRRVLDLELDVSSPKRIWDLGCGAGYFLYICRLLGHEVLGLDLDVLPMFAEITKLLGVRRIIFRIEAFVPLPDPGQKFDLITAFLVCFNEHKRPTLWGEAEWGFFLNDVAKHLAPGGRVWLELNREYDGTFYTRELREFFLKCGATISERRIMFNSGLPAPALTSPIAR